MPKHFISSTCQKLHANDHQQLASRSGLRWNAENTKQERLTEYELENALPSGLWSRLSLTF